MYVTFGAGFCLLPFVQDVEVCLQRIFPPKDFGNKSRVLEISDPVAVFSIFFYCFWCRFKILTSIANFDIRFVICMKNWPFSKKKVSHSEARFESYSTLKSLYGSYQSPSQKIFIKITIGNRYGKKITNKDDNNRQ